MELHYNTKIAEEAEKEALLIPQPLFSDDEAYRTRPIILPEHED